MTRAIKPRPCKCCKALFTPERPDAEACSRLCGLKLARPITVLTLPWPERNLHPNARVHYMVLSKAKKAARESAAWAAKAAWPAIDLPAEGRLHLWMDFYPPDRRHRDDDGLLSSMKAARDGIADALGINDSRFVSHPYIKDEVRKGGAVEIRITPEIKGMA